MHAQNKTEAKNLLHDRSYIANFRLFCERTDSLQLCHSGCVSVPCNGKSFLSCVPSVSGSYPELRRINSVVSEINSLKDKKAKQKPLGYYFIADQLGEGIVGSLKP